MKTLHSMVLVAAALLLSPDAFAAKYSVRVPTCEKMAQGPSSPEACRASVMNDERMKQHRPAVYKMYKTPTGDLCKSASSASQINNNRCQEAVDELKHLLDERKNKMADRCGEIAEQVQACQRCQSNLSAAGCQQEDIKINEAFSKNGKAWIESHKRISKAVKNVEDEMFQLSEDYGQNLSELQGDMMTGKQTSPAAKEIGASSISEGLSKHGNATPAEIFRAVEELRNKSEVTSSDIQEAQSIQSQYARESLSRALEAKAARLEMEKEITQEANGLNNLSKNTQAVSKNTTNLSSVDPAASQSAIGGTPVADASTAAGGIGAGIGGALGAGGATATPTYSDPNGGQQVASNTYDNGTYVPGDSKAVDSSYMLNGVASNNGGGAKTAGIEDVAAAEQVAGDTTAVNGTSASRMSVRESLRAKLAGQLAQGKGGVVDASQATAGKAGSPEEKLKAKASSEMLAGFRPEELSMGGGGDSFSMAQSETDAAVKEMMGEFEGVIGGEEGEFGGARHLASVGSNHASAPEILAADSSDLFLRTRTFYERCQKRGCVTR